MGRIYPTPDHHIRFDDNGERIWSSDGPPVNLLPEADWLTGPLTVAFPDFVKRNAYYVGNPATGTGTFCMSAITAIPGDWGPAGAGVYNLPDIVLGSVPAGVNYLDVRVTLARTKNPSGFMAFSVPSLIPAGENYLPGGSCQCEWVSLWRRLFEIVLVGQDVVLRRYQSLANNGQSFDWLSGNSDKIDTGAIRSGWTYGGGSSASIGTAVAIRDRKIRVESPANKDRATGACSTADNTNYASTFAGSFKIRPGYIKP